MPIIAISTETIPSKKKEKKKETEIIVPVYGLNKLAELS